MATAKPESSSAAGRMRAASTGLEAVYSHTSGTSHADSTTKNNTTTRGRSGTQNSNVAPELLVWRRLQRGELPDSLEQSAKLHKQITDTDGRQQQQDASWDGAGSEKPEKKSNGPFSGMNATTGLGLRMVPDGEKLSWGERVKHFTWTWFTMTMATGGIANVLWSIPFRFKALYALGAMFFILNLVLFAFNVTMISIRFYLYPKTFRASFVHPTESLFIPAAIISIGTIFINISQYGLGSKTGPWLDFIMRILFWIYCVLAIAFSSGIYLIMWSTQTFTISQMTPIWIFPAYPLLIVGPHAAILSTKVATEYGLSIIVGGFILQGIGFMVSLMIYASYLYRLMTQKLPVEGLRPGMFISVGPSGFTISGLVNMGQALQKVVTPTFMGDGDLTAKVTMILANWAGIWLWGLAMWFFIVSVGAHTSVANSGGINFSMTWYSFVFPNTALTTSTFAVARALDNNKPIQILGCVMAVLLVAMWIFVFVMMIRAVIVRQILWPQKQEDRDEGGWRATWAPPAAPRQSKDQNQGKFEDAPSTVDGGADTHETLPSSEEDPMAESEMTVLGESTNIECPPFTRPTSPDLHPPTPPDMAGRSMNVERRRRKTNETAA